MGNDTNLRTVTITMTINEDTAMVEELDMTSGLYDRVEYCDVPCSIRRALMAIREDLEWDYKVER